MSGPTDSLDASCEDVSSELSEAEERRKKVLYVAINLVAACVCLALGITMASFGLVYGLTKSNMPGPGLYPFIVGLLLTLLSVLWLLDKKQRGLASAEEDITVPDRRGVTHIVLTLAAGVGFILILNSLGYQLTMLLYIGALLKLVSHRNWFLTIVMAASFSFGSYAIFVALLGVPLPLAQIPFLNSLGL